MQNYLEFEKGLAEIDGKAQELRALDSSGKGINANSEAAALEKKSICSLVSIAPASAGWPSNRSTTAEIASSWYCCCESNLNSITQAVHSSIPLVLASCTRFVFNSSSPWKASSRMMNFARPSLPSTFRSCSNAGLVCSSR